MKQIIGIVLIVLAGFLAYLGITKLNSSQTAVKVLGMEVKAEDKGGKEMAYVELGLAVISLGAGIFLLKPEK